MVLVVSVDPAPKVLFRFPRPAEDVARVGLVPHLSWRSIRLPASRDLAESLSSTPAAQSPLDAVFAAAAARASDAVSPAVATNGMSDMFVCCSGYSFVHRSVTRHRASATILIGIVVTVPSFLFLLGLNHSDCGCSYVFGL
jgi:hypothetical protein